MTEPRQIEIARSLIGTHEGDNPTIVGFARKIGELYPEMRSYAANYTSDGIAWCGVFVAYCMAAGAGIRPVFGPTDTDRWMWAQAWKQFGTATASPQIGDVLVLARHVTMYAGSRDGRYIGLGGNQSDSVKESLYSPDAVESIRRPPQAVQTGTDPDKSAVPFVPLDQRTIDAIVTAAGASDLAQYSWRDRGHAPAGYIKGMAVTFGTALRKLAARDSAAIAMVRVVEDGLDVFDHYELGTLGAPDIDRLRALWVVLTGLGMRESSGNYSEGRDMSASNTSADTAESGLFQMSWNAHTTSPEIPKLLDAYRADKFPGFVEIFREGVRAKNVENVGDDLGTIFQYSAKAKPAFAVETAAIGLRTLYTHWGPIVRREAEIVPAADALFRQVQDIVGATTTHRPVPMPDPAVPQPQLPAVLSTGIDLGRILQFVSDHEVDAHRVLTIAVNLHNQLHPDKPVTVAAQPVASAASSAPALLRPSVLLSGGAGIAAGILQWFGHLPAPGAESLAGTLTTMVPIVSTALGLLGGWGAIAGKANSIIAPLLLNALQPKTKQ